MACVGLFLTLFLPWYQETVIANGVTSLRSASSSLTGWGAFSFVEAAVLLVAAGVLVLLFVRAEGQAFHVPGGDGGVITAAGLWTCVLIVWRIFDKEGTTRHGQIAYTSGIEWGIFVALAVAAVLTYAGSRIRLAHEPEPPLPGEQEPPAAGGPRSAAAAGCARALRTPAAAPPRDAPTPGPTWAPTTMDPGGARPPQRRPPPPDAPRRPRGAPPPRPPTLAAPAQRTVRRRAPDPSEAPTQRVAPAAQPRTSPDAAPSRPAGPGRWTAARSRSSTSPSRRRPGWAARARPRPRPGEPEAAAPREHPDPVRGRDSAGAARANGRRTPTTIS